MIGCCVEGKNRGVMVISKVVEEMKYKEGICF